MNMTEKLQHLDPNLEFVPWPKIPRGQHEEVVITEKINGTNACIVIRDGKIVGIQSRKRFITVGKQTDNQGFAAWVAANEEDLLALGEGYHYGEWAGEGIQKNDHNIVGKKFFLFNTFRWGIHNPPPSCCDVVPVLYQGTADKDLIDHIMRELQVTEEAKGNTPEGVIVYYTKTRRYEKHTFRDQHGKWKEEQSREKTTAH